MDSEVTTESNMQPTFNAEASQVSSTHSEQTTSADNTPADPPQSENAETISAEDPNLPDYVIKGTFGSESDQAKAYPELQKSTSKKIQQLSEKLKGFTGAPEDGYTFELSNELTESGFELDQDNAYFKDFAEQCKKAGMNQETFQNQMSIAANYIHNSEQVRVDYVNNAIEKQIQQDLDTMSKETKDNFVNNVNVASNIKGVTAEELNHFADNLDTSMIETFNKFMSDRRNTSVPVNTLASLDSASSRREELARIHKMPHGPDRQAAQDALNERYRKASY